MVIQTTGGALEWGMKCRFDCMMIIMPVTPEEEEEEEEFIRIQRIL